MITEPSAALLAYNLGVDVDESANVLVVRLGGLSSDITIMNVHNGLYSVVDAIHLPHLGGNILTQALSEYLAAEFRQKWKLDPRESRRTMVKLNQTAEDVKHILSSMPSAHVFVESLMDGIDWSQNISRARFENIIAPKLTLFSKSIDEFIKKNNVQIDKVTIWKAHNEKYDSIFNGGLNFTLADYLHWWYNENTKVTNGHFFVVPER